MKTPPDEFGSTLRSLRKSRGWSADRLSRAIGRGETYVGEWERNPKLSPNRESLSKIADVLGLPESERRALYRLAELRCTPEEIREHYDFTDDGDILLLEKLLTIEHECPYALEPKDAEGDYGGWVVDSIGWVLAALAGGHAHLFPPFTTLEWPDSLQSLQIVPRSAKGARPVRLRGGEHIIESVSEELGVAVGDMRSPLAAYQISRAMADAYRDTLFTIPEMTQRVVELLDFWAFDRGRMWYTQSPIELRFLHTRFHERFGVANVSCDIVTRYAHNQLARHLWMAGQTLARHGLHIEWSCPPCHSDFAILHRLLTSTAMNTRTFDDSQPLRDAIYMFSSPVWPHIASGIRAQHNAQIGDYPDLELHLDDRGWECQTQGPWIEALAEPWRLATIDPAVLVKYARYKLNMWPGERTPLQKGDSDETVANVPSKGKCDIPDGKDGAETRTKTGEQARRRLVDKKTPTKRTAKRERKPKNN